MINILIRQAVSPDIELLMGFDHGVKSNTVWQMNQNVTNGEVTTSFTESHLPREMRLAYPRNTQILQDCWHFFSCVLVACVDKVPVGYITVSTSLVAFSRRVRSFNNSVIKPILTNARKIRRCHYY